MNTEKTGDREVVISRIFNASRALVFKAWTEPARMAQWWGPHQFTNPVCELDVRPGGAWRILMRGPDGSDHPAHGVFREVVPPERIVMTISHSELPEQWHDLINPNRDRAAGRPAYEVVNTVTFEDLNGKTKLTIRAEFESSAVRDAFVKLGMNQGWSQSLQRLESLLAKVT